MLHDPMAPAGATPTTDPLERRFSDFATLGEALDYAATGRRGMNFHDARGTLQRAYLYAGLCTVSSVLGGCLGYFIGFHLGDLGHWLLALLGHADGEAAFREWFGKWGLWVILIKGLTPIPYKLVTIASGLAHFSFVTFLWASVVTRGARFFLTATLLKYFGPAVREEVEKRLTLYTVIGVAVLVGAFVAVRALG